LSVLSFGPKTLSVLREVKDPERPRVAEALAEAQVEGLCCHRNE
jgi:hypothetical protein